MSEDLKGRLHTLAERNDEPLPVPTTYPLSDDEAKERYLDLLAEGMMPEPAARSLARTSTWFKRRRNPNAVSFDEAFAEAYEEIMRPDGFHREAIVARARAALMEAAETGNVRAIEKILMAYDPEFNFLRPIAQGGHTNVEQMLVVMGDLPTPLLRQVREALVSQQKALPDVEA